MKKEKPTTKLCRHCKTEIPYDAKVCPQCRKKQKGGLLSKILLIILVFAVLGALGSSDDQEPEATDTNQSAASVNESAENELGDLTLEQKNALGAAKSYLSFSAFSYSGLIDQLEYEGYSTEVATFAVDNCGADWNEQACNQALDYLNLSAFSYSGLISQLEFEGFTAEQATQAVDNCGADWNEQAAKKAKEYLDVSEFSRSGLIDQLEYEGFTAEQAEYGVTQVGY